MRRWRDSLNPPLSQEEAARRLGIAREWLSRIENNRSPISAAVYLKLRDLMGREPDVTPVNEDPSPYGGQKPITHELREHLDAFIDSCEGDTRRLAWAKIQLEEALPLDKWRSRRREAAELDEEDEAARQARIEAHRKTMPPLNPQKPNTTPQAPSRQAREG